MKLVKAIVRPDKVDDVRAVLEELHLGGMTVSDVRGHGRQKGHTAVYRGKEYEVSLLPKVQIELVVGDSVVEGGDKRDRQGRTHRRDRGRPHLGGPVELAYNIGRANRTWSEAGVGTDGAAPAGAVWR